MSTCKECKYFVESKQAGFNFNPQPFGRQQTPGKKGACHLNPPSITGQRTIVSENDWCGKFEPRNLESSLNDTAEQITDQDDESTE